MPAKKMVTVQADYSVGQLRAYEFDIELNTPGDSDWVLLPEQIRSIGVTISFTGGGSGKVQTSTDKTFEVKSGTTVPIDWDWGEVNTNQSHALRVVPSAIRLVQINAGTAKLTIRAN